MAETTRRERLADRFANRPFLMFLVLHPVFVFTTVALFGLVLAIGLVAWRIWPVSPPGIEPRVVVSLVDLVQAWSLARTARAAEAAGDDDAALKAWQAASGNNPASLDLLRALLSHELRLADPRPNTGRRVLSQVAWLLRLSGTNRQDLSLAIAACDTFGFPEALISLTGADPDRLSSAEEVAFQKALFLSGRVIEFRRRWQTHGGDLTNDTRLELCRAAYLGGWGPPDGAAAGRARVEQALDDREHGTFASRLQLMLCEKRLDPDGFRVTLERLQARRADLPDDHFRFWNLLATAGRMAEARAAAENALLIPETAGDAARIAQTLLRLNLADVARRFLERYAPLLGDEDSFDAVVLWATYADVLTAERAWDALQAAALRMRSLTRSHGLLDGFSHFLDGKALRAQGHNEEADAAFAQATKSPFPRPEMACQAATELTRQGQPALALRLLEPIEPALASDLPYWQAVFEAAFRLKQDADLLLKAAMRAYQLQPRHPIYRMNYAAALLITRRRPAEALQLTLDFIREHPNSTVGQINHSFALVLNERFAEAGQLLARVDPARLGPEETSVYHLCALEVHFRAEDYASCWRDIESIDPRHLFAHQIEWVAGYKAKLPPRIDKID